MASGNTPFDRTVCNPELPLYTPTKEREGPIILPTLLHVARDAYVRHTSDANRGEAGEERGSHVSQHDDTPCSRAVETIMQNSTNHSVRS